MKSRLGPLQYSVSEGGQGPDCGAAAQGGRNGGAAQERRRYLGQEGEDHRQQHERCEQQHQQPPRAPPSWPLSPAPPSVRSPRGAASPGRRRPRSGFIAWGEDTGGLLLGDHAPALRAPSGKGGACAPWDTGERGPEKLRKLDPRTREAHSAQKTGSRLTFPAMWPRLHDSVLACRKGPQQTI